MANSNQKLSVSEEEALLNQLNQQEFSDNYVLSEEIPNYVADVEAFLNQEEQRGNEAAKEFIPLAKEQQEYEKKAIEKGNYEVNEKGEKNISSQQMSPLEIQEFGKQFVKWNETLTKILERVIPSTRDLSSQEKKSLDEVVNASNKFNEAVNENIKDIENQPERAAEIGKTLTQNAVDLNKNHKDIRNSTTEEEFTKNTDKLTDFYGYVEDVLHKNRKEANKKDKIFTNAIKEEEKLIKSLEKKLNESYPKFSQELVEDEEELKMEIKLLSARIVTAKDDNEKKEFEEQIKKCNDYIENVILQKRKSLEEKIKNDEERLEALKEQKEFFIEARESIRKDLFKPAVIVADVYDKMIDILPSIIEKAQKINQKIKPLTNEFKDFFQTIKQKASDKFSASIKFLSKAAAKVGEKTTKVAEKLSVWAENIEKENFQVAYKDFVSQGEKPNQDLEFMKEVIKVHGTDNKIVNAVEAVTVAKNERPDFTAKLLQDTLNTEEYKTALESGQSKVQENIR